MTTTSPAKRSVTTFRRALRYADAGLAVGSFSSRGAQPVLMNSRSAAGRLGSCLAAAVASCGVSVMSPRLRRSAALPLRLSLLEERTDALRGVLRRVEQRELRLHSF